MRARFPIDGLTVCYVPALDFRQIDEVSCPYVSSLIEADREPSRQRAFLARVYPSIAEPKAHVTLRDADHYANVVDLGWITIYDRRAMTQLAYAIDGLLSPDRAGAAGRTSSAWPTPRRSSVPIPEVPG